MTDGDAKEWITVKVPDDDHERASDYKPDGATWGDCLVAGAERLNDSHGRDGPGVRPEVDGDALAEVERKLDQIQSAQADTVREALESAEAADLSTEELAREVSRRIDYAEIATQTADEVEDRLR